MMLVHPWTDAPCHKTPEGFSHSPECSEAAKKRAYACLKEETRQWREARGMHAHAQCREPGWCRVCRPEKWPKGAPPPLPVVAQV